MHPQIGMYPQISEIHHESAADEHSLHGRTRNIQSHHRQRAIPWSSSETSSTFEECFTSVKEEACWCAVVPIENLVAGHVSEVHQLLRAHDYYIVGEHFLPVHRLLIKIESYSSRDEFLAVEFYVELRWNSRLITASALLDRIAPWCLRTKYLGIYPQHTVVETYYLIQMGIRQ